MAKTTNRKDRRAKSVSNRYSARVARRSPLDLPTIAKAYLQLAVARAERDAELEHKQAAEGHGKQASE
jgi:hypothetical protein